MALTILLESCDGQVFEVEKRAVLRSRLIAKKLRRLNCNNQNRPVVLDSLNTFDAQFVDVDLTTLFTLIQAAGHLKIKTLMDLTCGTLSNKIKGKYYEEIVETLENWRLNVE